MSSQLSDISGWEPIRRKGKLAYAGLCFLAMVAVFLAYQGVVALVEHRLLYLAFYLPAAVTAASILATGGMMQILRRRGGGDGCSSNGVIPTTSGGVRVQTALMVKVGQGVSHVVGAVACAVFSYGMWSGHLSFPMSPGQVKFFPIVIAILGASALLTVVWFALGLARFPIVEMAPTRLMVGTYTARQVIEWSDVTGVEAVTLGNHAGIEVRLTESARADVEVFYRGPYAPSRVQLRRTVTFTADIMATGAAPLLALLQYYAAEPAARQELADGRAYQRLMDGMID